MDLFESPAPDDANRAEISSYYPSATQRAFEQNYLSFHDELPRVLRASTAVLLNEVAAASCRLCTSMPPTCTSTCTAT